MHEDRAVIDDLGHTITYAEALLWIETRSVSTVKGYRFNVALSFFDDETALPATVDETIQKLETRFTGYGGIEYVRSELRKALLSGRIVASGQADGFGRRREIPPLEWIDLDIRNLDEPIILRTGTHVCRHAWRDGEQAGHCYANVLFDALTVLSAFPPVPAALPDVLPWHQMFSGKPSIKQFVTSPEVDAMAREHLKNRGAAVTKRAVARELAWMWNQVPAWGGGAKWLSFESMRRGASPESIEKKEHRKVR